MMNNKIYNNQKQGQMPNAQMVPNAINPMAFTNQGTIKSMFGDSNPGTFTRSVGTPLMQMTSQGYIPPMDPTNPSNQQDVNAIMAGTDGALQGYQQAQQAAALPGYGQAQQPPYGVQTPITPNYDLNGQ